MNEVMNREMNNEINCSRREIPFENLIVPYAVQSFPTFLNWTGSSRVGKSLPLVPCRP
jgi:hypothetical protein